MTMATTPNDYSNDQWQESETIITTVCSAFVNVHKRHYRLLLANLLDCVIRTSVCYRVYEIVDWSVCAVCWAQCATFECSAHPIIINTRLRPIIGFCTCFVFWLLVFFALSLSFCLSSSWPSIYSFTTFTLSWESMRSRAHSHILNIYSQVLEHRVGKLSWLFFLFGCAHFFFQ